MKPSTSTAAATRRRAANRPSRRSLGRCKSRRPLSSPCAGMVVDLPGCRRDFNATYPNVTLSRHQPALRPMIFRLFRRDPQAATIAALYGVIVAQARNPGFYLEYGVPDTPEG